MINFVQNVERSHKRRSNGLQSLNASTPTVIIWTT